MASFLFECLLIENENHVLFFYSPSLFSDDSLISPKNNLPLSSHEGFFGFLVLGNYQKRREKRLWDEAGC
jgi:hypothetical protein